MSGTPPGELVRHRIADGAHTDAFRPGGNRAAHRGGHSRGDLRADAVGAVPAVDQRRGRACRGGRHRRLGMDRPRDRRPRRGRNCSSDRRRFASHRRGGLGRSARTARRFCSPPPARQTRLAVARAATLRFSTLGVISVGTLLVTGIVNTWYLAGSIEALTGTYYGQLLLAKIALFFAMVAIAAVNRQWLTPRLMQSAGETERAHFRRDVPIAPQRHHRGPRRRRHHLHCRRPRHQGAGEPCRSPSGLWRAPRRRPPSCTSTPNRPWPMS